MSVLLRHASLRRLQVVLGLALMGLVLAPSAFAATSSLDTVSVTDDGFATINAQSGPSGENPSGFGFMRMFGNTHGGPVTCLSVTGNIAILNLQDQGINGVRNSSFGVVTVQVVDNGGNGEDVIRDAFEFSLLGIAGRTPADRSPFTQSVEARTLTNGRAVVFDAPPPLPASKEQCKDGGWRNFPEFKNPGQCVAFVGHAALNTCLAERAQTGRAAFRAKYGEGRRRRHALRRCLVLHGG